jgi:hypothetical protein
MPSLSLSSAAIVYSNVSVVVPVPLGVASTAERALLPIVSGSVAFVEFTTSSNVTVKVRTSPVM